jgi:hypothetical protein
MPTDTGGITYVNLKLAQRARLAILAWARSVSTPSGEPADARGVAVAIDKAMLRKELEETRERLAFEEQKARDLQSYATRSGLLNFGSYEGIEGKWKLLFDYEFFWGLTRLLESLADGPNSLRAYLHDIGMQRLAGQVNWDQATNLDRTRFYIAKVLRLIRTAAVVDGSTQLDTILNAPAAWPGLGEHASVLAEERSRSLLTRPE